MLLKERLAQKLEDQMEVQNINNAETICEPDSNLVLIKSPTENIIKMVPDFAITLSEAQQRLAMLQEFVRDFMQEGVDYGNIPGCNKPTLLKAGAEKLCDIYGFSKRIEVTNRLENWELGIFSYEIKAILVNKTTGVIEAEGCGSCNTRERKFKTQDPFSIVNTVLKMAKKRALVDAVLSATRSSGIFSQDIEDLNLVSDNVSKSQGHTNSSQASLDQLKSILTVVSQRKIPIERIKELLSERYNVVDSKQLTAIQAEDMKQYLIEKF